MAKLLPYKHFLFLFIYFLAFPSVSHSVQAPAIDNIYDAVKNVIYAEDHPYFEKTTFVAYREIIEQLYLTPPSSQALLWLNSDNIETGSIVSILQLMSTADNSGLDKTHYHLSFLNSKWTELINQQKTNFHSLALLDTAISINLLHYLSDLHFGRIDPQTLKFNFDIQKNFLDFIPIILNAIQKNEIDKLSELVEPKHPAYRQLKTALSAYRKQKNSPDYNKLNYLATLRPEDNSPQVIAIRQKLNILGITTNKTNGTSCLYDEDLVDNIKKFQLLNGLKVDGVIGKRTILALSPNRTQRIRQIELALERLRWLPKIQPGPLVLVNIPAFQLWAYESEQLIESQALNMKVIVGKSADKLLKSPIFTADMYYLEFSPYWNVPKSITIKEILPKLEEDPLYIEQQNMELVTGFHNNEAPVPFTEDSIELLKNSILKIRQRPGGNNALGKVKFIFPNNYNVYLHDTPSRRLFNKPKRDLSHGCIRVEKPTELASFLLKTKPEWSQKKILKSMQLSRPKQVRLSNSVPVIIFYSTAFPIKEEIVFFEDIYGYDIKLNQALLKHHNSQINVKTFPMNLPMPHTASINMNKI